MEFSSLVSRLYLNLNIYIYIYLYTHVYIAAMYSETERMVIPMGIFGENDSQYVFVML